MSVTDEAASSDGAPTPSGAPAKRRHTARNAAIAVGVVMVALIALLATRGTNEPISSKIVGQAAPAFSGETIDGSTFTLANSEVTPNCRSHSPSIVTGFLSVSR